MDFQILRVNVEGEVSVHAMKPHRGKTDVSAIVVNLGTRCE